MKRFPIPRPLLLLLLLLLAMAGCGPVPTGGTPPPRAEPDPPTAASADPGALLSAYHWRLADARDARGQRIEALFVRPGQPLQLDFADGRLAVSNACNRIGGAYALGPGTLQAGPLAATRMACADPGLAALDQEAGARLDGTLALAIDASGASPRLELATAAGERLFFDGLATAATRHGSPPERIFLEVAATTRPCHHPLIADQQCLQVRQVHYDGRGLKTGEPGRWENFYDQIEDYVHQPGVRNVLRIDRYTRRDVPADASGYAYVLDMVVESEDTTR